MVAWDSLAPAVVGHNRIFHWAGRKRSYLMVHVCYYQMQQEHEVDFAGLVPSFIYTYICCASCILHHVHNPCVRLGNCNKEWEVRESKMWVDCRDHTITRALQGVQINLCGHTSLFIVWSVSHDTFYKNFTSSCHFLLIFYRYLYYNYIL